MPVTATTITYLQRLVTKGFATEIGDQKAARVTDVEQLAILYNMYCRCYPRFADVVRRLEQP